MRKYEKQIQEYGKFVQEKCVREDDEKRIINECRSILAGQTLQKQLSQASYFEFLYEQSRFIKKSGGFYRAVSLGICGSG